MKKVFFAIAAFAVLGLASCKKCGKCDVGGTTGDEFCEKDSQTLYDAAKAACEAAGGDWVTS